MSRDRFNEFGRRIEMQQESSIFQQSSDDIKAAIDRIHLNTRELSNLHRKALAEMNPRDAQVDALVDETGMLIQEARNELKGLTGAPGGDPSVKQVQQKALARKLMDCSREYQSVQQAAKAQYQKNLERQFRIAKPNATREEIQEAIKSGGGGVFQQQIMSSRVADQRRMLQQVQGRQNELEKIEQSLIELVELMQDMQMLLDQQQTFVNQIETNIDNAALDLEMGSKELTKAVESSRSVRKKKWIMFCCVLVCFIVLAIGLWVYVISPLVNTSKDAAQLADSSAKAS